MYDYSWRWRDLVCLSSYTIHNWMKMLITTVDYSTALCWSPAERAYTIILFVVDVTHFLFIIIIVASNRCFFFRILYIYFLIPLKFDVEQTNFFQPNDELCVTYALIARYRHIYKYVCISCLLFCFVLFHFSCSFHFFALFSLPPSTGFLYYYFCFSKDTCKLIQLKTYELVAF